MDIELTKENEAYLDKAVKAKGMSDASEFINAMLDGRRKAMADKYAPPHFLNPEFKN